MLRPRIDFSQYGQPSFFRRFVPPGVPKWVVDVGAHDGVNGSNSREFVLEGWQAVLVEPLPAAFDALERNCKGMESVRLRFCACSNFEGRATFYIGSDGDAGQSSSLCDDETWRHNHGGREISVAVSTLTTVLRESLCPATFAALLVDAEGMDLEVLQGLDFTRFRPAVICTEIYRANRDKDSRKHELLIEAGYALQGTLGSDTIWTCARMVGDNTWETSEPLYRGTHLPDSMAAINSSGDGIAFLDNVVWMEETNSAPATVTISGWGMAPDRSIPELVLVGLEREDGTTEYAQSARHPRPDVAGHYKTDDLLFTGFVASWKVPKSGELLKFRVLQSSGRNFFQNAFERPAA